MTCSYEFPIRIDGKVELYAASEKEAKAILEGAGVVVAGNKLHEFNLFIEPDECPGCRGEIHDWWCPICQRDVGD